MILLEHFFFFKNFKQSLLILVLLQSLFVTMIWWVKINVLQYVLNYIFIYVYRFFFSIPKQTLVIIFVSLISPFIGAYSIFITILIFSNIKVNLCLSTSLLFVLFSMSSNTTTLWCMNTLLFYKLHIFIILFSFLII